MTGHNKNWKPIHDLRKTAAEDVASMVALARKRVAAKRFLVRQAGLNARDIVGVTTRLLVDLCRIVKRYNVKPVRPLEEHRNA